MRGKVMKGKEIKKAINKIGEDMIEILTFLLGWFFEDILEELKDEEYPDKVGSMGGRYPVIYY